MTHFDLPSAGSIHLIGGGRDAGLLAPLFTGFVADAAEGRADAASPPRIGLFLVREPGDGEIAERFAAPLRAAGAEVTAHVVEEGDSFGAETLVGVDGIAVGGGLTPAYLAAVAPITGVVRDLVAAGAPYLGFSAGSAIAADRAIVGGYRLGGVEVGAADAGEELDEVTVADGLALVPFAVDVHAAQWGTLSRLVAAVDAGRVAEGYAIDEHTVVIVRGGAARVVGTGAAWRVFGEPGAVQVTRVRAAATV